MTYTLSQAELIVNSENAVNGVFGPDKLRAAVAVILADADAIASWESVACAKYIRGRIDPPRVGR